MTNAENETVSAFSIRHSALAPGYPPGPRLAIVRGGGSPMTRVAGVVAVLTALPFLLLAQVPSSASADVQLQLGDLFMNEARYRDAIEPYRRAIAASADDPAIRRKAEAGLVVALLRTGDFTGASGAAARVRRDELRFLESFNGRTPVEFVGGTRTWTVPIRIVGEKVTVRVKVNGSGPIDFVLDTGAEQTVVLREVARRHGIVPITYMQSAGVGDIGLRGLQVGRLETLEVGDLKVKNVPCLIKNPPLGGLPQREPESFSPIALGLSMRIDYARRELIMARELSPLSHDTELPLRMYRLPTVRGIVNRRPATFVIDT